MNSLFRFAYNCCCARLDVKLQINQTMRSIKQLMLLLILLSSVLVSTATELNIDSLKQALNNATNGEKLIIYNQLFKAYESISYEKAFYYATEAYQLAKLKNDHSEIGTALKNIGKIFYYQQNSDSANFYFNESLDHFILANDSSGMAKIYNNLGLVFSNSGRYNDAIPFYQKSLELKTKLYDSLGIANSFINIGSIYYKVGSYKMANDYFLDGLSIAKKIGSLKASQSAYGNLGLIYTEKGDFEQALEYHNQALEINNQINNIAGISASFANIGQVYLVSKELDKALDYFLRAQNLNDSYGIVEPGTLNSIGQVYAEMDNPDQALFYFHRAWDQANEIKTNRVLQIASQNLYITYGAMGDYEMAFEYALRSISLSDSLRKQMLGDEVLNFESKAKIDKKNQEISQLNKNKHLSEAENEAKQLQSKIQQFAILALALLVFILLVLLIRNKRRKSPVESAVPVQEKEDPQLRVLLDASDDMMWMVGAEGNILLTNKAFQQYLGADQQQLLNTDLRTLQSSLPEHAVFINENINLDEKVIISKTTGVFETQLELGSEEQVIFEITKIPVADAKDNASRIITIVKSKSVHPVPLMEQRAVVIKETFEFISLYQQSAIAINKVGICVQANVQLALSIDENIIDRHYKDWGLNEACLADIEAGYVAALNNHESSFIYHEVKNSEVFNYTFSFKSYAEHALLFISPKGQVEELVAPEMPNLYKNLYKQLNTPLLVCAANGLVKDVNVAAAQLLGLNKELDAEDFFSLLPDNVKDRFDTNSSKAVSVTNQLITTFSGKPIQVAIESFHVVDDKESVWVVQLQDLSAKIETEKSMNAIRQRVAENEKSNTFFLANMSHEIRTPLNAIIGFSNLVSEAGLPEDQRKLYIDNISKSGNALLHLIEDLIDYSKIDAGQITLNEEICKLSEFFTDSYSFFTDTYASEISNGIEFRVKIAANEQGIAFFTDVLRLKQVMSSMITNAFKFTNEGSIDIGYNLLESDEVEFFVEDTGKGIATERLEYIFDRFSKTDFSPVRDGGGSGLGLTISKRLIALMGGNVQVESTVGKGTRFSFRLPYKAVVASNSSNESGIEDPKKPVNWKGKQILIAEDVEPNYQLLKSFLRKTHATLHWAKDGREAVEMCQQIDVDIIIMDIQMPVMNGIDAMQAIKAKQPDIPVIAQTAYALADDRPKILDYGFDEYISKPIKISLLMKMMTEQLGKKNKAVK